MLPAPVFGRSTKLERLESRAAMVPDVLPLSPASDECCNFVAVFTAPLNVCLL